MLFKGSLLKMILALALPWVLSGLERTALIAARMDHRNTATIWGCATMGLPYWSRTTRALLGVWWLRPISNEGRTAACS